MTLRESDEGVRSITVEVVTNNWLTHDTIARILKPYRAIRVLPHRKISGRIPCNQSCKVVALLDRAAVTAEYLLTFDTDNEKQYNLLLGDCKPAEMCQFILLGFRGFLGYREVNHKLRDAIGSVANGHLWVPRRLLEEYVTYSRIKLRAKRGKHTELTPRQRQIVALLQRRCANKEISSELHISENTVKFHLAKLFSKFGVHDRQRLADLGRSDM
jgi:DNA-binding NarL/FixJ family response regulator